MKILLAGFKYYSKGILREADFVMQDGKTREKNKQEDTFDLTHEAGYIIPPLFDSHIHGGWGADFETEESFSFLEKKLREHGISYALPTLHNYKWEKLAYVVQNFKKYKEKSGSDFFSFMRIEGPFINREMCGAQDEKFCLEITQAEVNRLLKHKAHVKLFTFAPELKNSEQLVAAALKEGMIPSVGHANAALHEFLPVYRAGVRHFTHFGNRMGAFHHREIGLIGSGLQFDDTFLEIIGDGAHVAYDFLSLVLKIKPGDRIALVSDAIKQGFLKDKELDRAGYFRENSYIKQSQETIAGGETLLLNQAKRIIDKIDVDLAKIINMISINPLLFFNIPYNKKKVTVLARDFSFLYHGEKV